MEHILSVTELCLITMAPFGVLGPIYWFSRFISRTDKKIDRIENSVKALSIDMAVVKEKVNKL